MEFKKYFKDKQSIINKELKKSLSGFSIPKRLKDSMLYSLLAGGKRLRPSLVLMTDDLITGKIQKKPNGDVLKLALALEFIHTYSLIHDDLPAMDDDDLRRGKPTNHIKYDEATAILAGDAILTFAFQLLAQLKNVKSIAVYTELVNLLSSMSGAPGMVGGQMIDIDSGDKSIPLRTLKKMHSMKTGALISASVLMPVIYRDNKKALAPLKKYSELIGMCFQITDDVLDITSTEEQLGKPVGSDLKNIKSTYVSHLGLDKAKKEALKTCEEAKKALDKAGFKNTHLHALADYIVHRVS